MSTTYTTEDGFEVATGDRVFNYYDRKAGTIEADAGQGWFDLRQDDGTTALLDGSRICTVAFAQRRGWM